MKTVNQEIKLKRRRIWRSIVTTLAAIVVFVTTYALIIPAITWETTLICELDEHVHTAGCYNADGELKCVKQEHTHTDSCFDAPGADDKMYVCNKSEHAHAEGCYFTDGTLKCTLEEHQHTVKCKNHVRTITSEPTPDGAVAVICGVLPQNAQAEIDAVPLSEEQLIAFFGKAKAAAMTGYVAYDIRIMVDGVEWQPDDTVNVTVQHPNLALDGDSRVGLAHVADGADSVTDIEVTKDENGDVVFDADGFSLYIFYTYTVDFHFGGLSFSINGLDSILLSDLFEVLDVPESVDRVCGVVFSDETLLRVEVTGDGDWLLTSLAPFDTNETLTVTLTDESTIVINVTDDKPSGGGGGGGGGGDDGGDDDGGDDAPPEFINPCDEYLTKDAQNKWQIVKEPYNGNEISDKTAIAGDSKTKLQKNVVPTDKENEFLVYLSASKPASLEEWLNERTFKTTTFKQPGSVGSISTGFGGSKSVLYNDETTGSNKFYVHIVVYDHFDSFTENESTGELTFTNAGTKIADFWQNRSSNTSKCSNGSLLLPVSELGTGEEYDLQCGINFHDTTSGQGSGQEFVVPISLDTLSSLQFENFSVGFDTVEDKISSNVEFLNIEYCDGTCVNSNGILQWTITENPDVKSTTINTGTASSPKLSAVYNNVAQLVYRVRLKTEAEGFDSCAEHISRDNTYYSSASYDPDNDTEAYEVNDYATITYHKVPMEGGSANPIYGLTGDFPVPYVRGLHYDLRFQKVSDDGKVLSGAIFQILDASQTPMVDSLGNAITYISDEYGYVNIMDLTVLPSYVKEITPPPGYQLPTNPVSGPLTVNYTSCSTALRPTNFASNGDNMRNTQNDSGGNLWSISNTKLPGKTVVFKKVDAKTGNPVNGAKFALYGSNANGVMNASPMSGYENLTSNLSGIFSSANMVLPFGTYYLKEISARSGYQELTAPICIEVKSLNSDAVTVSGTSGSPTVSYADNVYTITVQNERITPNVPAPPSPPAYIADEPVDVTIKKQIDYLGDNGIAGMDELYRLYLSLETQTIEPMNLLLVIDQSTSMQEDVNGNEKYLDVAKTQLNPDFDADNVRQKLIKDFLNGTSSNGFIAQFLNANEDNHLAILTFGSDCSADRYIYQWDYRDTAARSITLDDEPAGATNYAAALDVANVILADAPTTGRTVMIFLSDGVPTLAYKDGAMHSSFDNMDNVVGKGDNNSIASGVLYLDYYIGYLKEGDTGHQIWNVLMSGLPSIKDDKGVVYSYSTHFIETYSKKVTTPDFEWPVTYFFDSLELEVPGTKFPEWGITDQAAFNSFCTMWDGLNDDKKLAWVKDNIIYPGDAYDIFYLTESAFTEFNTENPDVPVFSIFFSATADEKLTSERPANEVLLFMSGDTLSAAANRRIKHYQSAESGDELASIINAIAGISGVVIDDSLSEYVDFVTDPEHTSWSAEKTSKLEITLTNGAYSTHADYPYLYKDGAFTNLGNKLLDTTATKFDTTNKTVKVVFKPEYIFNDVFKCVVSFNVCVNDTAYQTYYDSTPGGYNAIGSSGTDYPGNSTSSEKDGFYSNNSAIAEWTYYGEYSDIYPMPVVQVRAVDVLLRKHDAISTSRSLAGAEFDLYREYATVQSSCIIYNDGEANHYLVKVNSDAIVSTMAGDGYITMEHLYASSYWLFETKAPAGYERLTRPVYFKLSSDLELDDVKNANYGSKDVSIDVPNIQGCEFPETGGPGTRYFYVIGALLVFGALTIGHILWRRRDGRSED